MAKGDFPPMKPAPMKKAAVAFVVKPKMNDGEAKEGAIKAPEGMDMEGKKPGDTVEVVTEYEIGEGGMLMPKKINGLPVGEQHEEAPREENPEQPSFEDSVMGGPAPEEGE